MWGNGIHSQRLAHTVRRCDTAQKRNYDSAMTPYQFTWISTDDPGAPGIAKFDFPNGEVRLSMPNYAKALALDDAMRMLQQRAFIEGRQSLLSQIMSLPT